MARLKAAQRKEQLIEVGTQLFARRGYDGTTTAEIAKTAGVTEPILYRHFKNKQELFIAIVRAVSDGAIQRFEEAAAGIDDPAERLRRISAGLPEYFRRSADAYHVLHGALTCSRDETVIGVIREHYSRMHGFFKKLIRDGQTAGAFRKDMNARSAAWHVVMTGVGYAALSLNVGMIDKPAIAETIDEFLRAMKQ